MKYVVQIWFMRGWATITEPISKKKALKVTTKQQSRIIKADQE